MAATREVLDGLQCSNPGCSEDHGAFYLHSSCHRDKPTWAVYENGELRIECSKCKREVVTVKVASAEKLAIEA